MIQQITLKNGGFIYENKHAFCNSYHNSRSDAFSFRNTGIGCGLSNDRNNNRSLFSLSWDVWYNNIFHQEGKVRIIE